jgi:hypothetical protein
MSLQIVTVLNFARKVRNRTFTYVALVRFFVLNKYLLNISGLGDSYVCEIRTLRFCQREPRSKGYVIDTYSGLNKSIQNKIEVFSCVKLLIIVILNCNPSWLCLVKNYFSLSDFSFRYLTSLLLEKYWWLGSNFLCELFYFCIFFKYEKAT